MAETVLRIVTVCAWPTVVLVSIWIIHHEWKKR